MFGHWLISALLVIYVEIRFLARVFGKQLGLDLIHDVMNYWMLPRFLLGILSSISFSLLFTQSVCYVHVDAHTHTDVRIDHRFAWSE